MYFYIKQSVRVGLAITLLHGLSLAHAAGLPEVPATLDNVKVVDTEYVMNTMEAGDGVLLDARTASSFESGSIPGAINCATTQGDADLGAEQVAATVQDMTNCEALDKSDKTQKIVTLCNGDHCWRSPKAALALKAMGFENVAWYRLGLNDWEANGYPTE